MLYYQIKLMQDVNALLTLVNQDFKDYLDNKNNNLFLLFQKFH